MPHRPFRFGLQTFSADSAAEWRDRARRAEDLGYSALHLADHVLGPGPALAATAHPLQTLAAVPAMAVAAEATSTLKIGCRVFCIDYRPAAVLAKEAATLDLFSEGRLELGLGAGWLKGEYEALGLRFDAAPVRIRRLAEVVSLVKAHFSGEPIDVRGEHVQVSGFTGAPQPVSRPRPPLLIGGGGKRVLSLAAREADIVSLNFNNRSGVIGVDGVTSGTAEETERKIAWIREAAGERFDALELEIGAYFTFVGENTAAIAEGMAASFGLSPEAMRAHPHALFGSVSEVVDELVRRREEYGIHYVTVGDSVLDAFAPVVAQLAGK
ncbi:MAG: TIGR03621 family F420-dependent LLM class oxidoreductase [Proteobacteria bacterium]|nr:TIGR03621 family F420-dependent LLM class oxidoreductase [Pseudomonadota bacterium]